MSRSMHVTTVLFKPLKDIADPGEEGEIVGWVHRPDTPWKIVESINLSTLATAQVRRGNAVLQITTDVA